MKNYKKFMGLVLMCCLFMSGCGKQETTMKNGSDYTQLIQAVDDSSELPDWQGNVLAVKYWNSHGVKGSYTPFENDVVTPEIERITGVRIDEENSFGNGSGQTFDTKLGFLTMANDFPELIACSQNTKLLVDKDLIYDLTDYIEKYCPNIMSKFPKTLSSLWNDHQINGGREGKIYGIPSMMTEVGLFEVDNTVDKNDYVWFYTPPASKGYVWIREDILKMLYPNAKSNAQLQDMYMSRESGFSKEEILDVPINSKQDFIDLLYNIKRLNIKENGTPVQPIHLYNGVDNWYLLNNLCGYLDGRGARNDYFLYYDKLTGKVEFGFKTDDILDNLKLFNRLLNDGTASKESLIDTAQIFSEKLANGMYAVAYSYQDPNALPGQTHSYRKVYLNIANNTERYNEYADVIKSVLPVSIFKSTVSEDELIQLLRYFDFMISDVGEKLVNWGPATAGLWEEQDGKRVFLDKAVEDFMVYNIESDKAKSYGLANGFWDNGKFTPTYMKGGKSKFAPAVNYDRIRSKTDYNAYFSLGLAEPEFKPLKAYTAFITNFSAKSASNAWQARKAFEDALLKVLTASDTEMLNKLYADFLKTAEISGYDDKMLSDVNDEFLQLNSDVLDKLR